MQCVKAFRLSRAHTNCTKGGKTMQEHDDDDNFEHDEDWDKDDEWEF